MATKAIKLASGNWRVRVQHIAPDGSRHYKSFTASTRKEAEYLAAQFAFTQKEARKPEAMTVGAALASYIDARSAVLSPNTVREYRQTVKTYFGALSSMRLSSLRNEDIQRFVNALSVNHSPKTVRNVHALLSAALRVFAPDLNASVKLPARVRHEIIIPDQPDVRRLLEASVGTELENAILLAAAYGMRRGEICALLFSDINPRDCTISVTKSMAKDDANRWVLKSPKSYAGTRTFSISPSVVERLFSNRLDNSRVCPLHPDMLSKRFAALCKSLSISCRFHDLRHYNASVMLALSVPDKYAMERLGQSTPGVIKTVYQHIMSNKKSEVNTAVNTAADSLMEKCDTKCDTIF